MKYLAVMVAAVSLLLATGTASAEEKETAVKFRTETLWNLAGLPAYFFLETFIHEGSHILTAKALGQEVTDFKPYPHRFKDGSWLFGGFLMESEKLTSRREALIVMAPYAIDLALFTAADLILSCQAVKPGSVAGLVLFTAGMAAPFVDFVYNAHGFGEYNDFVRFSQETGANRYLLLAASEFLAVVAAYRLVARGIDVFFDSVPASTPIVTVAPFAGGGVTGFGASLRF